MRLQKNFRIDKIKLILFFLFLIWFILQILAPLMLPYNTIKNLSGVVGLVDNEKLIKNIPQPWSTIYLIGDILCHQKKERSYFINGNQMPFCSRCTGIFLGFAIGMLASIILQKRICFSDKTVLFILVLMLPLIIDGTMQLFGAWESKNIIRITTGTLTGVAGSLAVSLIIDEIKNVKLLKH
ncbi:MAG: DUF2085 domain-containing protein [Thermoplasmata archaeon]|nr:MAG: DUF2085 domain-containing protein [Thermoplasmata archaeon]